MNALKVTLRSFSIRTRMQGVIAMVLAKAKEEVAAVEANVNQIAQIVSVKARQTQLKFNTAMLVVTCALLGTLAVVVVLVVVPLTLLNSSSITRPISYAAEVAEAIAGGDLTRSIHIEGKDEAAQLLGALLRMQDSLRAVVGQVHESSVSIRNASAEVASGNGDLSHRTEKAESLKQQAMRLSEVVGTFRLVAKEAAH